MATIVLPKAGDVTEMFTGLLGRQVTANVDDTDFSPSRVARYVTRDDQLVAVGAGDLAMVCFSGAALSMMPAGGAQDAVAEGTPSAVHVENFHEVMNIAASLFMDAGSDHVRLDGLADPDDPAVAPLLGAGNTLRLAVEVSGYGAGRLSFSTA